MFDLTTEFCYKKLDMSNENEQKHWICAIPLILEMIFIHRMYKFRLLQLTRRTLSTFINYYEGCLKELD